jgi:hypothetical protein
MVAPSPNDPPVASDDATVIPAEAAIEAGELKLALEATDPAENLPERGCVFRVTLPS